MANPTERRSLRIGMLISLAVHALVLVYRCPLAPAQPELPGDTERPGYELEFIPVVVEAVTSAAPATEPPPQTEPPPSPEPPPPEPPVEIPEPPVEPPTPEPEPPVLEPEPPVAPPPEPPPAVPVTPAPPAPPPIPQAVPPQAPVAPRPPEPSAPPSRTQVGGFTEARLQDPFRPRYPNLSRLRGEQGVVSLRIEVRPDGTAGAVTILRSSGHVRLDETAVQAARKGRYAPARRGGRPVAGHFDLNYRFELTAPTP